MCKSCYRGHRYCSGECRKHGYARVRREARRRHEESQEARLDHRDRQRRYRDNLQISVTDQTSKFEGVPVGSAPCSHLDLRKLSKINRCIGCGRKVWRNLEV